MASHVTVIDTSARRAVVKTTPGKYLSDVLQEACTRLGLNASQYGLKCVFVRFLSLSNSVILQSLCPQSVTDQKLQEQ